MATYLIQASYTPEAWAAQVQNPQDRSEVIRPAVEGLGGSFVCSYLSFGDSDIVSIVELPDNVSVAAFSIAAAAGGAVKSLKTTPLLTPDEGIEALRKASDVSYTPPAG
jgi:uncharacterized protein with GYD domain